MQNVKQPENLVFSKMLSKHRLLVLALLFAFSIIPGNPAEAAQTISAHSDVSLTATAADYNAGEKVSANNAIDWTSDADWVVTVTSLNANLGQSDDLIYMKSLSDLLWKLSAGSTWAAMTTSDVTVQTGSTGSGSGSFNVDYKFLLSWALDRPGTYTTTLQYTITTQ